MFRSATFKLTMWYLALVMAISLVFSVVLYRMATGELNRGLHNETQRIYNQFPVFEGNPLLRPGRDYDTGAHRILLQLIGFNVIVFVGAGWASYLLAKRTLEPIEEAHEQQKRFTADVSHELRTPLTALKMETEVALMNNKNGQKELRETLASNLEEASKMQNLIDNLLRLTRLEAGELAQQFEPVNAKILVTEAIKDTEKAAEQKNITIKKSASSVDLRGDPASLTQLLVILLDNAIKYSPAESTVTLTSYQKGSEALFEVKDTGSGIERKVLEHAFDRFYRGSAGRNKSDNEGFGLGLSIAKMITDVHHGNITLSSTVNHGTTATVAIPIEPAATFDSAPKNS